MGEARKRVQQLQRIIEMIKKLEEEHLEAALESHQNRDNKLLTRIAQDVETLTESFYYFAFRLCKVVQGLPGLNGFKAVGIRDVRNKLIEHPEVPVLSFSFGGPEGPRVKGPRLVKDTGVWEDRGLYVNAAELVGELNRRLADLLKAD